MAHWAIRCPSDDVLELLRGRRSFQSAIEALAGHGAGERSNESVHGVELILLRQAWRVRRLSGFVSAEIHVGDFFSYCSSHLADKKLFDGVVGNPPFIRYQNFPEEHRGVAFDLMQAAGLHPNRLTNSWVPFLVATTLLLNEQGRMAMVVPAELLQVKYAAELRQFLSEYYRSITLITFRKLVFEGVQQEVVYC
jgi:adenine-specific DNA-methyltransferase